jgi:hypothetical protein
MTGSHLPSNLMDAPCVTSQFSEAANQDRMNEISGFLAVSLGVV